MAVSSTFMNGTAAPMIRCIAASAIAAFMLAQLTLRAVPGAPVTRSETEP
jgi:hypothetical protein